MFKQEVCVCTQEGGGEWAIALFRLPVRHSSYDLGGNQQDGWGSRVVVCSTQVCCAVGVLCYTTCTGQDRVVAWARCRFAQCRSRSDRDRELVGIPDPNTSPVVI
jgi:hypothetical protein